LNYQRALSYVGDNIVPLSLQTVKDKSDKKVIFSLFQGRIIVLVAKTRLSRVKKEGIILSFLLCMVY